MKTKILCVLLPSGLLALAAWFVNLPTSSQADQVPEKYRGTVARGLKFLVMNQHKNGHWEGDDGKHPVAMTGLVGLALLMDGEPKISRGGETRVTNRKHTANIRKAVDWLMEKANANRDGLIFSEHASETSRYMQGHGLVTLFLAGALPDESDEARRKKLQQVLQLAVKYIANAQSTQGGWYHTSKVEGHDFAEVMSTAIQIQALNAAENAGVSVPGDAIGHAREYLAKAIEKLENAKPDKNHNRRAETAAALACRRTNLSDAIIVNGRKDETRDTWSKYCKSEIPMGRSIQFGRDEITHYYYAQGRYFQRDAWDDYRKEMFDHLLTSQDKDGGWAAGDGIGVGRVYSTAVWCTILQLDNGTHLDHFSRPR